MIREAFVTAMTIIVGGVVGALGALTCCCLRRRCCVDKGITNRNEDDVSLSDSRHSTHVTESIVTERSGGFVMRWANQWHRSSDSTMNVIRNVFSAEQASPMGQNVHRNSEASPEYVAVPARMAEKIGKADLEQGRFSGDGSKEYRKIYLASRLFSKPKPRIAPTSPHYLGSDALRNQKDPLTHYFNPVCCAEAQPTSPAFEDVTSRKIDGPMLSPSNRNGYISSNSSAMSALTNTSSSVELNPMRSSKQHSVQNDIYTIYEDAMSVDSIDTRTLPHHSPTRIYKTGEGNHQLIRQDVIREQEYELVRTKYELDQLLSPASPVLNKGVYSSFIKQQSLSPTKFSV